MLTASQIQRVAYIGDDGIVCRSCVENDVANHLGEEASDVLTYLNWEDDDAFVEDRLGLQPVISYEVDEQFPGGLWCDACGGTIAEPAEGYCLSHDAWQAWQGGANRRWCDEARIGERVDIATARECSFPGGRS